MNYSGKKLKNFNLMYSTKPSNAFLQELLSIRRELQLIVYSPSLLQIQVLEVLLFSCWMLWQEGPLLSPLLAMGECQPFPDVAVTVSHLTHSASCVATQHSTTVIRFTLRMKHLFVVSQRGQEMGSWKPTSTVMLEDKWHLEQFVISQKQTLYRKKWFLKTPGTSSYSMEGRNSEDYIFYIPLKIYFECKKVD